MVVSLGCSALKQACDSGPGKLAYVSGTDEGLSLIWSPPNAAGIACKARLLVSMLFQQHCASLQRDSR